MNGSSIRQLRGKDGGMENVSFGGRLGSMHDRASGQQIGGQVFGSFSFRAQGDESSLMPLLQQKLVQATSQVIANKLMTNQVAVPTIAGSAPYYVSEIIAAVGADQLGAQITDLKLTVKVDNLYEAAAMPAAPAAMPPNPMQAMQNAYAQAARDQLDPSNYDVHAKINVGGFKINASTDGGIDTEGLKDQVKDKVKTELIWYGIGCVVVGFVLVLLGAIAIYAYSTMSGSAAPTGEGKAAAWDGSSTFSCGGNDNVKLTGVTANLPTSTAIKASGNCKLDLVGVDITAKNGIEALANAKVTVTGGSIKATDKAASALGAASITFSGTTVSGKQQALGSAKITGP
jgi:hypothetical protein